MPLVGSLAPTFKAKALLPNGKFEVIDLESLRGKYVILYFYPLDFTFVCPSEIIAFDKARAELEKLNTVLLGVSVDSEFTHAAWTRTPLEQGGIGKISHPLISDLNKSISTSYGVLLEEAGIALRGLFLIDQQGIIRHMVVNDLPLGRSVEETLRMVHSLQYVEKHGEVCPAGWNKGQPGMKPTQEGVGKYLGSLPK